MLVVTKACVNEKLWPLSTNEGERRGGEGALLAFECVIPSPSGELAVVSALVGALGATRLFGWCADCRGRERLLNGLVERDHSSKPYSDILSSAAEVLSLAPT